MLLKTISQGIGSSRGLKLCINLLFGHLNQCSQTEMAAVTQKYMQTNFQIVLFTDATLDGPDGCSGGWLVVSHHVPTRL